MSDGEPLLPDETVLPDDYPIFGDYLYVADGKIYRSDWHGISVRQLKVREGFNEVRRCNIVARQAALSAATPPNAKGEPK